MVTCEHVIGTETIAFRPETPTVKVPVRALSKNEVIYIAILDADTGETPSLRRGTADNLKQMDHIAIAGFPNFRHGDTGTIIPGLLVGFRTVSAIRRILTNAPIIAGNSGSPAIGRSGEVIGVAVTGADRMEEAQDTENHGIIPIDALKHLMREGAA